MYENTQVSIAKELAAAAGITQQQASKVLDLLKVQALFANAATLQKTLKEPGVARALRLGDKEAKGAIQELSAETFRLKDLVLGVRPANLASVDLVA